MKRPLHLGSPRGMPLHWIPLAAVLLPAFGVHLSYILAAAQGHVPWCLVYIEGCSSISATGRNPPERYVFLASILPTAVLLMAYWRLNGAWLAQLRSRGAAADLVMTALGVAAAAALFAYALALGQPGSGLRLVRRIAVALFYLMTFAAQLVLTWQLFRLRMEGIRLRPLIALCAAVTAGALASLGLTVLWEGYRALEDAFEWSLTALIFLHLLVTGSAWRDSGFAPRK